MGENANRKCNFTQMEKPEPMTNHIPEAHLFDALVLAVQTLREREKKVSPTYCSNFRKGLEENLEKIRRGIPLEIR